MCGLFAVIAINQTQVMSKEQIRLIIKQGLNVISHRGPDGLGMWISETADAALGHARLSIIDLEDGQQPLSNQKNTLHTIVNGEFYDYEKIRKDIKAEGYFFKTKSDSEIILPLYEKYGTTSLKFLNGEFSLILHNSQEKITFIARDRFGIKPLYYSVYNGYLYVASEIKSLFAAGIKAKWDKNSYVSRSFYFGNSTLYENIYQVPPAHFMIINSGNIQTHKYWDISDSYQNIHSYKLSKSEYIDILKEKFNNAIKRRLKADVEVGAYLSGGIDSSAVLAVASKYSERPLRAFTLCFDEESGDFNEGPYAKLVAQHVNANFNPVNISEADIVDNFSQAIWHNEAPFFNGHGIAKFLLSKTVREQKIKVVLTGEGADEVLAGYPHFQRDFLQHSQNNSAYDNRLFDNLISNQSDLNGQAIGQAFIPENIFGFTPEWIKSQESWLKILHDLYKQEYYDMTMDKHPIESFLLKSHINYDEKKLDTMHLSMYLWIKSFLPNFILKALGDRMEMANSVEGRLAFLDHDLAEFAFQIPSDMKVNENTTKHIFREAVKEYLPLDIYNRKKNYFRSPNMILKRNSRLYHFMADMIHSNLCKDIPFYDIEKLKKYFLNHEKMSLKSQIMLDSVLMEVLSILLLHSNFSIMT